MKYKLFKDKQEELYFDLFLKDLTPENDKYSIKHLFFLKVFNINDSIRFYLNMRQILVKKNQIQTEKIFSSNQLKRLQKNLILITY